MSKVVLRRFIAYQGRKGGHWIPTGKDPNTLMTLVGHFCGREFFSLHFILLQRVTNVFLFVVDK